MFWNSRTQKIIILFRQIYTFGWLEVLEKCTWYGNPCTHAKRKFWEIYMWKVYIIYVDTVYIVYQQRSREPLNKSQLSIVTWRIHITLYDLRVFLGVSARLGKKSIHASTYIPSSQAHRPYRMHIYVEYSLYTWSWFDTRVYSLVHYTAYTIYICSP